MMNTNVQTPTYQVHSFAQYIKHCVGGGWSTAAGPGLGMLAGKQSQGQGPWTQVAAAMNRNKREIVCIMIWTFSEVDYVMDEAI